jgi:3-phenylpropionate/cinnamic acid dioxygenase small subunit
LAECGNRATPPPSSISRRAAFLNTQMGLGHERFDPALNASASDFRMSESNHRQFYRRRAQLMAADNWTQMPSRDAKCGSRACMTTSSARWSSSLYREARLLDERRFHEWLELFTDNARYWMGGRSDRFPKSSKAIAILDPDRPVEDDRTKENELAILDETRETLARRVARLDTGMAWAEDPPWRTRLLIANVEVEPGDAASELKVRCDFIAYRSRAETEQDFFVGTRRDVLRRLDGGWKIARRKLTLDQNVLSAKN